MRSQPEEIDAAITELQRLKFEAPISVGMPKGSQRLYDAIAGQGRPSLLQLLIGELLHLRDDLRLAQAGEQDAIDRTRDANDENTALRAKVERVEAVLEGYNAFLEDIGPLAGELVPSGSGEVAAYRVVVLELEAALLDEGES